MTRKILTLRAMQSATADRPAPWLLPSPAVTIIRRRTRAAAPAGKLAARPGEAGEYVVTQAAFEKGSVEREVNLSVLPEAILAASRA